jgi:alkanesulfonate monooxygenase SsuD/methylene tetrahydromethanopterin reductase-like flavin-dependent oxidoreductase (luciferase family)
MQYGVFLGAHNFRRDRSERRLFEDLTAQAVLADELGFEVAWLPEHHFNDYNLLPDPFQLAVQILERTQRIRVGFGILILPNHHPLVLAGRIAQLSTLYPGRVEFGLGRGSSGYEEKRIETVHDPDTGRRIFFEHLDVLSRALRGQEDFSFDGEFYHFPEVTVLPREASELMPPLWLASTSPGAAYGQVLNAGKLGIPPRVFLSPFRNPVSMIEDAQAHIARGLAELGLAEDSGGFAINRTTFVAESKDELDLALDRLEEVHQGLYAQLEGSEKYSGGNTVLSPVKTPFAREQVRADTPIGSVEHVIEHVQRIQRIGVDHYSCYFDFALPHELACASMRRFAEQVRPAVDETASESIDVEASAR